MVVWSMDQWFHDSREQLEGDVGVFGCMGIYRLRKGSGLEG